MQRSHAIPSAKGKADTAYGFGDAAMAN